MPYDFFISYSRRDNAEGRITQLVERIKADFANFEGNNGRELKIFFDQQEITGMKDWRQRIIQVLRESRLLLACLSPAYLKSEYCEWEFEEYLRYEIGHLHAFNGVAPIYFVEVPGWDSKDFEQQCAAWIAELRKRQHFDLRPWHDQGEEALREAAVQESMDQLNRQIVQTITRGERAEKSLGNVDSHNPHFIGRTAACSSSTTWTCPALLDPAQVARLNGGDRLHVFTTTRLRHPVKIESEVSNSRRIRACC